MYLYLYLLAIAIIILNVTIVYKKNKEEHKQFLQDLENEAYRKRDEAWLRYNEFI
jgi:hypothetical protein